MYPPNCINSRTGDDAQTESVILITGSLLCDCGVLSHFLGWVDVSRSRALLGRAVGSGRPCRVSNAKCTGLGCTAGIMCASMLHSHALFVGSAACYAPSSSSCSWLLADAQLGRCVAVSGFWACARACNAYRSQVLGLSASKGTLNCVGFTTQGCTAEVLRPTGAGVWIAQTAPDSEGFDFLRQFSWSFGWLCRCCLGLRLSCCKVLPQGPHCVADNGDVVVCCSVHDCCFTCCCWQLGLAHDDRV